LEYLKDKQDIGGGSTTPYSLLNSRTSLISSCINKPPIGRTRGGKTEI